jgi:hypothetical protein
MAKKKSIMARAEKLMKPKGKRKSKRMLDNPWGRGKRESTGMVDRIANRAGTGRRHNNGLVRLAALIAPQSVERYMDYDPDGVERAERKPTFFDNVIHFFETWQKPKRRDDDQG